MTTAPTDTAPATTSETEQADINAIGAFIDCLLVAEVRVIERITGQRLGTESPDGDNVAIMTGLAYLAAKRLGFPEFTYDDAQQLTATEQLDVIRAVPTNPPADRPAAVAQLLADPRVQAVRASGE